jgi:hypothetical protein
MKFVASQREISLFMGAVTLIALCVVLTLGAGSGRVLDSLTGIAAGATGFFVVARLALGAPARTTRRYWQFVLVLLGLVCIAQLAGSMPGGIELELGIGNGARYLMLVATALVLSLIARFDEVPAATRRVLWLAFAIQVAGTAAVLLSQEPGLSESAARWGIAADFLALISMQLYLLGAVLFVAYLRRQLFVVQRRRTDVGDLARYLYATTLLHKKVRHPRIGSFTVPGHKLVLSLGRFIWWFPKIAPQVSDRFGVSVWQQFRDLCVVAFRHGLDTQVYYMFELYRPEHRARASGYLTRYEMKNGLYKVLTLQVPKHRPRIMLGYKLTMYRICQEHGIATVPILIVAEDGKLEYLGENPAGLQQDLFLKPRQSKGSRGAEFLRYADGTYIRENGETLDPDGLIAFIGQRSKEAPILVQPRIGNHPGLADLADTALMRIRVITCLDDANKPVITHAVLSNLCKLELTWPTDIEFGAAIDLESGALGMMTGDKAEAWLDWWENHPITHARVFGRIVPCWDEVRSIVLAAHVACKDRLLIGWDVAVGPAGAVLLEGNSYPDVDFLQRSHQCAAGDSPLGPILYARLVDLERRSATGTLRGPLDFD